MNQNVAHSIVLAARADELARAFGRAALACLLGFVVTGLTALGCNTWLSAEGLWHAASPAGAFGGAWLVALAGPWHLHASLALLHSVSVRVLVGSAELPWNLFTVEALAVAALVMRASRRAVAPAPVMAVATFVVNMLLAMLVYELVSQVGGIPVTRRTLGVLAESGFRQALIATPATNFRWVATSLLLAVSAWVGCRDPAAHHCFARTAMRRLAEAARGALWALGLAGVTSWVVLLVTGAVDLRFDRLTSLEAVLFVFGAPAWAAQGLGIGTAAPMTVKAAILGIGTSVRLGMLAHDEAATWSSVVMLVVILVSCVFAGRRFVRREGRAVKPYAFLLGPAFAILLCAWLAGSNFSVDGRLSATLTAVGQVLSQGLLGMPPLAGHGLSGLARMVVGRAGSSGLTVGWGVRALQAFPGAMVIGTIGSWLGGCSVTETMTLRAGDPRRIGEEHREVVLSEVEASTGVSAEPVSTVLARRQQRARHWSDCDARGNDQDDLSYRGNGTPTTTTRARRTVCALCRSVESSSSTRCSKCGATL